MDRKDARVGSEDGKEKWKGGKRNEAGDWRKKYMNNKADKTCASTKLYLRHKADDFFLAMPGIYEVTKTAAAAIQSRRCSNLQEAMRTKGEETEEEKENKILLVIGWGV